MDHEPIKQDVMDHLVDLTEREQHLDASKLLKELAEEFNAPEAVIRKIIAEWEAGRQ